MKKLFLLLMIFTSMGKNIYSSDQSIISYYYNLGSLRGMLLATNTILAVQNICDVSNELYLTDAVSDRSMRKLSSGKKAISVTMAAYHVGMMASSTSATTSQDFTALFGATVIGCILPKVVKYSLGETKDRIEELKQRRKDIEIERLQTELEKQSAASRDEQQKLTNIVAKDNEIIATLQARLAQVQTDQQPHNERGQGFGTQSDRAAGQGLKMEEIDRDEEML